VTAWLGKDVIGTGLGVDVGVGVRFGWSHRGRNVGFIVVVCGRFVFSGGATLPLPQKGVSLILPALIISFKSLCPLDYAVKETLFASKLGLGLRPRHIHLSVLL